MRKMRNILDMLIKGGLSGTNWPEPPWIARTHFVGFGASRSAVGVTRNRQNFKKWGQHNRSGKDEMAEEEK